MGQEGIYVGIDVAKAKVDVAVRPTGGRWEVPRDEAGIPQLVSEMKTLGPSLVLLEATGGLELPLVAALAAEALPVVVVNPRQVRDFARATGKLAKTDALDAAVLAHFAEAIQPPVRPLRDAEIQELNSLTARRQQVMTMQCIAPLSRARPRWRAYWPRSGPVRWFTPMKRAGVRTDTTATCGLSAPPTRATSCGGVGAKPWWTRRWAILSPECWSAISTLPTTIMMAPNNGAGPTCCGTSTTCAPATLMTRHWHSGPMPSTNFTARPKPAPIPRKHLVAPRNWPWNGGCWPSANPSCSMRRQPRPSCADASSATSKNSSSSWPNPQCLQTTTPPNAACAIWSSAARSAAVPGPERGTDSKMTLASLLGTWRVQGLNPLTACRQLLRSPQL